jgi:DNA repair protein RadC
MNLGQVPALQVSPDMSTPNLKITASALAFHYLQGRIHPDVEEFWALALNSDKRVLDAQCLFRGTVDACLFHPRDLFRFACLANASTLIVAHSHPSGNPTPSPQDLIVTRQILNAADLMQMPVDDHIILAGDRYFSFADVGILKRWAERTNLRN